MDYDFLCEFYLTLHRLILVVPICGIEGIDEQQRFCAAVTGTCDGGDRAHPTRGNGFHRLLLVSRPPWPPLGGVPAHGCTKNLVSNLMYH